MEETDAFGGKTTTALDELDQGSIADGSTLTVRLTDEKTMLRFRRRGL